MPVRVVPLGALASSRRVLGINAEAQRTQRDAKKKFSRRCSAFSAPLRLSGVKILTRRLEASGPSGFPATKPFAGRAEKIHHRGVQEIWQQETVIAQTQLIARSLKHWTRRNLLAESEADDAAELAEKIFHAPFVLVAHGTEADPVLNYGNAAALALWEMSWDELTRTPSRLTAEAPNREERARLLAAVTANGFIDDYSGIRISKTGRRFRIAQATVWNLLDERGNYSGQAAMFSRWELL